MYVVDKMRCLSVFPLIGLFILYSQAQLYVDQSWEDFKVTYFIQTAANLKGNLVFRQDLIKLILVIMTLGERQLGRKIYSA